MRLYAFLLGMWALMILGGGIAVLVLGPLDIDTYGSVIKGVLAILLVVIWVLLLVRLERYIFKTR